MSDDRPASATTVPEHIHKCPRCGHCWFHSEEGCEDKTTQYGWGQWARCPDCQEG